MSMINVSTYFLLFGLFKAPIFDSPANPTHLEERWYSMTQNLPRRYRGGQLLVLWPVRDGIPTVHYLL